MGYPVPSSELRVTDVMLTLRVAIVVGVLRSWNRRTRYLPLRRLIVGELNGPGPDALRARIA
jgi:hypothetical protein